MTLIWRRDRDIRLQCCSRRDPIQTPRVRQRQAAPSRKLPPEECCDDTWDGEYGEEDRKLLRHRIPAREMESTTGQSAGLGAPFGNANIGDPITASARKAGFNVFAFEVGASPVQTRLVDILQHVDVDNCIEVIRDFAGN